MATLKTPYGEFALTRRATIGGSVVRAKHRCRHHGKALEKGDVTLVEHRRFPTFREHVAMSWGEHVATYDLGGNQVVVRSVTDEVRAGRSTTTSEISHSGGWTYVRTGDMLTRYGTGVDHEAARQIALLHARIATLTLIAKAATKYRNVCRGFRAEDKTIDLPDVSGDQVEAYEAELRLKLFALLDESEEAAGGVE